MGPYGPAPLDFGFASTPCGWNKFQTYLDPNSGEKWWFKKSLRVQKLHQNQGTNTTQHNTTQHNTTQHNTTQHNTTQHNTTKQPSKQGEPTQVCSRTNTTQLTNLDYDSFKAWTPAMTRSVASLISAMLMAFLLRRAAKMADLGLLYDHAKKLSKTSVMPYHLYSITSWWFQPVWKICSSNWIICPGIGVKIKNIWVATS